MNNVRVRRSPDGATGMAPWITPALVLTAFVGLAAFWLDSRARERTLLERTRQRLQPPAASRHTGGKDD